MAGLNGLTAVGAPGTGAGFLNNPAYDRQAVYEMRKRSAFGMLSKPMSGKTRGRDSSEVDIDPSKTSAVLYKTITQGDTVNWTMEKVLKGAPIFGDRVPEKGPYLDFWHTEVKLNLIKSPAFQIKGEFEEMKAASTLDGNDEQRIRAQAILWNAALYSHDHIKASLCGASDNLLASQADGGLALDLGRGAGKQVSPINAIVRGSTGVIGGATLAAREANLISGIGTLTNTNAKHLISVAALHDLDDELATGSGNFEGIDMNGEEVFLLVLPSQARGTLLGVNSTQVDFSKYSMPLTDGHPLFQYKPYKVGKIVTIFDDTLGKYAPDITGPEIVWGKNSTDPQSWDYKDLTAAQKARGVGLCFGKHALRTAQAKSLRFTTEKGPHEVGAEIATKTYRSIVRSAWKDKQVSGVLPLDQSFMAIFFAMIPNNHGV